LVGFYDPNQENADKISKEFGKHFSTIATLIPVDVIDIVTPTLSHYKCASCHQIRQTRFIENPFQTPLKRKKLLL
jgi:predicted dehydrogenase